MKRFTYLLTTLCSTMLLSANVSAESPQPSSQGAQTSAPSSCAAFLDHSFRKLHAKESVDLCELTAGKPVLIVNTASNCGFTPQFKALEAIHKKYKDDGLVVIGFPADNFFQEEDEEKDTAEVCFVNYGVTFTMLQTTSVRGDDANAVFKHLGEQTTSPKWNFYKYLVSKDGKSIQHFNSRVSPDEQEFIDAVEQVL